ncbi:MAG: hypothetical protein JNM33_13235 [Rubrivivax sp.]|nr:hypothetical protein [Rubrivivax sp.]
MRAFIGMTAAVVTLSLPGCYIVEHVQQENAEYARLRQQRDEAYRAQARADQGRPPAPVPAALSTGRLNELIKDYQWRSERWFLSYGENRGGSASPEALRLIGFIQEDLQGIDAELERLLKEPKLEARLREQFQRQRAHYRERAKGWGELAQPWKR